MEAHYGIELRHKTRPAAAKHFQIVTLILHQVAKDILSLGMDNKLASLTGDSAKLECKTEQKGYFSADCWKPYN